MSDEEYRLLEAMGDRVTDLAKSYRVLNDNHTQLRLDFTEMRTRLDTAISIVKWVLAPISGLTLLLRILEIQGVIN